MNIQLIGSGWRDVSLVDVHGSVTFTLWLCGCNLKCPYCHNWRLADMDRSICKPLDINKLLGDLEASKSFIDYFHVTGGEPLLQYKGLIELFKAVRGIGVPVSLDSNLTLYKPLKLLLDASLVDHVATDLRAPFAELAGVPERISSILLKCFEESLKLVVERNIPLELRVPVAKGLTARSVEEAVKSLYGIIGRHASKTIVIVNPLLSRPLVEPRNVGWCSKHCMPEEDELEEVAEAFRKLGFRAVVKEVPR